MELGAAIVTDYSHKPVGEAWVNGYGVIDKLRSDAMPYHLLMRFLARSQILVVARC